VGERIDSRLFGCVGGDAAETSQRVDAVDIHSATSADTLAATSSESQGRINLILDSDQGIQHHGTGLVKVEGVCLHLRLRGWLIWIPSIDVESLGLRIFAGSGVWDC